MNTLLGVGSGPVGTEDSIGFCSQIAIFYHRDFFRIASNGEYTDLKPDYETYKTVSKLSEECPSESNMPYTMQQIHSFPYRPDNRYDTELNIKFNVIASYLNS